MLRKGMVKMVLYVAPTELEYRWIIRSTNISSLRDYKPMNFNGITRISKAPLGAKYLYQRTSINSQAPEGRHNTGTCPSA